MLCCNSDSANCTTNMSEFWDICSNYYDTHKPEEEDLWLIIDRREWREYLKTLWLSVLGAKQYICLVGFLIRILYYRRLLFPISGWLARAGQNKRN